MCLKKWEGERLVSSKTFFGNIVQCLSRSKYYKIETTLLVHVIKARQCPEFHLTLGQKLQRCMGGNQSPSVTVTLGLKEARVPFIFCA